MKWIEYEVSGYVRIPYETKPPVDRDAEVSYALGSASDYIMDAHLYGHPTHPVSDCSVMLDVTDFKIVEDS